MVLNYRPLNNKWQTLEIQNSQFLSTSSYTILLWDIKGKKEVSSILNRSPHHECVHSSGFIPKVMDEFKQAWVRDWNINAWDLEWFSPCLDRSENLILMLHWDLQTLPSLGSASSASPTHKSLHLLLGTKWVTMDSQSHSFYNIAYESCTLPPVGARTTSSLRPFIPDSEGPREKICDKMGLPRWWGCRGHNLNNLK